MSIHRKLRSAHSRFVHCSFCRHWPRCMILRDTSWATLDFAKHTVVVCPLRPRRWAISERGCQEPHARLQLKQFSGPTTLDDRNVDTLGEHFGHGRRRAMTERVVFSMWLAMVPGVARKFPAAHRSRVLLHGHCLTLTVGTCSTLRPIRIHWVVPRNSHPGRACNAIGWRQS